MKRFITLSATVSALALASPAMAEDAAGQAAGDGAYGAQGQTNMEGQANTGANVGAPQDLNDRSSQDQFGAGAAAGQSARMDRSDTVDLSEARVSDEEAATPLQLPVAQVEDADVVTHDGDKIGSVEAVLRDQGGEPGSLLVELDEGLFEEGRLVAIGFDQVEARPADGLLDIGDSIEIVSHQSEAWFESQPDMRADSDTNRMDRQPAGQQQRMDAPGADAGAGADADAGYDPAVQ